MSRRTGRTSPQTAFDFGAHAAPPEAVTRAAGGVVFRYRHDEEHGTEYFSHEDARGWTWEAFRHTHPEAAPEIRRTWYARVAGIPVRRWKGREVTTPSVFTLNMCLSRGGVVLEQGPLYGLDCHDVDAILGGLARLARAGAWPENAAQPALTIFNNGSPHGYEEPQPLASLFRRLEAGTLDPKFEDDGGFFFRMGSGAFRARGDFADAPHYFDLRGPLGELLPLARALKLARLRPAYQDTLRLRRERRA